MEEAKYGVKNVPNIKISLMDNEKIIHTIEIDYVSQYEKIYNTLTGNLIRIYLPIINLKDYQILLSKKYEKYIIETQNLWRNAATGQDEIIEEPVVVCNNCSIYYEISEEKYPTVFELTFMNEVQ